MAGIPHVEEAPHAAGDEWTADAADRLSPAMLATYDALILRHFAANGKHRDPRIPVAAALVTWGGATYTLRSGYNVGALTRTGAGAVKVDISGVTLVADAWGAEVSCVINDVVHVGSYYDSTTTTAVNVQLVDSSGAAADVSFLLLVYGVLA